MKSCLAFFVLLYVFIAPVLAQHDILVFKDTSHSVGQIPEGVVAHHDFIFRNVSADSVRLRSVVPECGCTAPSWTQTAIAPGGQGVISVAFDSAGRPGPFKKAIDVNIDGSPAAMRLFISGTVLATRLEEGVTQGNLLFTTDIIDFGTIAPGRVLTRTVRVQNNSKRPIHFDKSVNSETVRVSPPSRPLFHKDVAEIRVILVSAALEPGKSFDISVPLSTNDATNPVKSLRLTGRIATFNTP